MTLDKKKTTEEDTRLVSIVMKTPIGGVNIKGPSAKYTGGRQRYNPKTDGSLQVGQHQVCDV